MMDGIIIEKVPVNRFFRKKVGFWFGMWVWTGIAEKHNVFFDDFDKIDESQLSQDALYFAADWYAFKHNKRRIKESEVAKWIELMPVKQVKRIHDCMSNSRIGGKTIMEITESKKKQAPKK